MTQRWFHHELSPGLAMDGLDHPDRIWIFRTARLFHCARDLCASFAATTCRSSPPGDKELGLPLVPR